MNQSIRKSLSGHAQKKVFPSLTSSFRIKLLPTQTREGFIPSVAYARYLFRSTRGPTRLQP